VNFGGEVGQSYSSPAEKILLWALYRLDPPNPGKGTMARQWNPETKDNAGRVE